MDTKKEILVPLEIAKLYNSIIRWSVQEVLALEDALKKIKDGTYEIKL